jgi:ABC-2 type transport system ATP-binding protein
MKRSITAALLGLVLLLSLVPAGALLANEPHSKVDGSITSHDGTTITYSLYRPGGASAEQPVPVILHSHGWGGSRTSGATAFQTELNRGYGVLSFDQRGFGSSGGSANVQDPDLEGRDVLALIDFLASLEWVEKDLDEHGAVIADDPVLFAMGGSYGGGYQLVGALTDLRDNGRNRFNALAPEITWFDLSRSLAPEGVVRTAWVTLLYAAGAGALVDYVHPAFAYGAATGQWPDGTVPGIANLEEEFRRHGPAGFVAEGLQLDIPVLVNQGASDNLFNLNEGLHNFERTLTDQARDRSLFVGFNGGHALPNVLPVGYANGSDACTGGFSSLRLAFFDAVRGGGDPSELQPAAYNFTTAGGTCVRADAFDTLTVEAGVDVQVGRVGLTPTGVGAPQHLPIAAGPITVAGIPTLSAAVTSAGADQRVFFALSVGSDPLSAQVVQNNMMPLRELLPVVQERRTIELPGMAVEVPAGQNLYLVISPVSDMSFGHGSLRTPGAVVLENITVTLPVPVAPDLAG